MKDERGFYSGEEAEEVNNKLTENLVRNIRRGLIKNGFDCVPGMHPFTVSKIYKYPLSIKLDEIPRFARAFGMTVNELFSEQKDT